ncbi:MAG: TIGR01777 family oxidoreductase [Burkholderiales bacterium]
MRIAVTGASGLIGSALLPSLRAGGHEVLRLVRRSANAGDEVRWDPLTKQIDAERLEGLDAVVHLSGENIAAGRWTDAKKARLRSSRVGSTRFLSETLAGLTRKPSVLVSASALGYYGDRGDTWVGEADPPASDFFGQLSVEWEAAAAHAAHAGIRVVHPRTGIVLSPAGGALGKMLLPFELGVGGCVGSGRLYFSWNALDDVVGVIHHLLARSDLAGPVNASSPEPVTNAELTKTLGRVLGRPTIVPVPAFALRIAFGEVADALLASTRMRPERLLATGYRFRFPELEGALRHVLRRPA